MTDEKAAAESLLAAGVSIDSPGGHSLNADFPNPRSLDTGVRRSIDEPGRKGASDGASLRSVRRRLVGWMIGSLIVSGLMFLVTLFFVSVGGPPWIAFLTVMTGLVLTGIAANLWMTLAAIGTVLVFGPRWDWQLIHFGPLAGIAVLLGLASDADGLAMWLMSIVIVFFAAQLLYLVTIGVRRMRGYQLVHRSGGGRVSHPIAVQLQWNIADLMMTTTLVAAAIASLGWSYRTMQDDEGLFGPFFGLVIVSLLGGVGFAVFFVAMLPPLLICMNRDTPKNQKIARLGAHLVFCFSCWMILAAISMDTEFTICSLLMLSGITFGNFVIQPILFGDQSKSFPFGFTRVRAPKHGDAATNPPSPEA